MEMDNKKSEKGGILASFLIGFFVFVLGGVSGYVVWGTEDFSLGPFNFSKEGQKQFQEFYDMETGEPVKVEQERAVLDSGNYSSRFSDAELANYINNLKEPQTLFQEMDYDDGMADVEGAPFVMDTIRFYIYLNPDNDDYKARITMLSAGRTIMDSLGIGKWIERNGVVDVNFSTFEYCMLGFCMDALAMGDFGIDGMDMDIDDFEILSSKDQIRRYTYLGNKQIGGMTSPCFRVKHEEAETYQLDMCMHPEYTVALTLETSLGTKMFSRKFEINKPIADSIFRLR